uniref:Secreted protein n=1 Tax=Setaria viridis TaxID=4556 RepID=A0A4U6TWX4_SETVI|nr:hypothetical protein SEVIR_7G309433v2 [Setaria viridis]
MLLTVIKLSWMLLCLMKANCDCDTMFFMCRASRMASTFVIILMNECIKLIGLKSGTASAPSFFGNNTTLAVLIKGRLMQRKL